MAKSTNEVRVVTATGTAQGNVAGDDLGQRIADAMHQAVVDCLNEGIVDPDEILKRKFAARDAVLSE